MSTAMPTPIKDVKRRIRLVAQGIRTFKDWDLWLLARFHISRKSGVGKFRFRDGTEFLIDYSHNDVGTFQELWLMGFYEQYRTIQPGDTVIDIGASIGAFSVLAAQRGAKVFAYEPTPRSFALLSKNVVDYNVIPYNLAVAGEIGHAELLSAGGDEGNSLVSRQGSGPGESFRVKTTTLDAILSEVHHCNFLKMDCEGGEVAILKHASLETLVKIDYIAMEYHRNLPELLDIFKGKGFDVITQGGESGFLYATKTVDPVTIVFSSNDYFALLLGVALCSIFENKKGNYSIHIYVIDAGISGKNKERLAVLEKRYGFKINYLVPDEKQFASIPVNKPAKGSFYLPIAAYYRLAIANMLPPTCRKLLYLDVDLVIRGDIAELFNIDLEGKTMGAIADCFPAKRMEHLRSMCKSVGIPHLPSDAFYFNSGVLLIDFDRWRELNIEEKLFTFISEHWGKFPYHDQDTLDVVLLGDCKELSAKYNFLTEIADEQTERDPLIVHFVGGGKPWYFLSAVPWRSDYLYYVKKTPWKNERYRKVMDVYFAKKYHLYSIASATWNFYKKLKQKLVS
jgi:FkbM family methyltransferase